MPNKLSAKKELRKGKKREAKNQKALDNLKTLIKKSRQAIEAKGKEAEELVKKTLKALDKATQKGLIKKNTRDRRKSRLHKKLNKTQKS
ncbi:30S ribosomal protein S20 [Candidatus Falkowbacteria bacterium RIFOXYB2_FULL_47_14]|uniref:Small ribosomal subunit protein bS20 n=1 Tax=Candidatus Falkowbacteria bacterium RIFOXYA2_FULL_47_19 TaxID=1797994 RepID=A0A1F5SFX8_9BACT|nr:MAG: 30S ribosomal protein S20 [Candidatus Falkowbacteria bacterium RIFOXYA2_FULL_47_19]OGF35598.1 MAG: 30S ribosomal protein S20 [Candidatus Falkowbacteria bacterium RIFOXYC2_FULL_46_15]OGF42918.1 MAG: 30S ribosomal protein S20 [Candidatus Falkowbacteria bacterium RIFOXYB2_FULL_47_14]